MADEGGLKSKLESLKELHEGGLIDETEYKEKKAGLLAGSFQTAPTAVVNPLASASDDVAAQEGPINPMAVFGDPSVDTAAAPQLNQKDNHLQDGFFAGLGKCLSDGTKLKDADQFKRYCKVNKSYILGVALFVVVILAAAGWSSGGSASEPSTDELVMLNADQMVGNSEEGMLNETPSVECPIIYASNDGPIDTNGDGNIIFSASLGNGGSLYECSAPVFSWMFSDLTVPMTGLDVTRNYDVATISQAQHLFPIQATVTVSCPQNDQLPVCNGTTQLTGYQGLSSTTININDIGTIRKCNSDSMELQLKAGAGCADALVDQKNWTDSVKNGCGTYAYCDGTPGHCEKALNWCKAFGTIKGAGGLDPNQACCACGGGSSLAQKLKVGSILSGRGDPADGDPSCFAILRKIKAVEPKGANLLIATESEGVSFLDAFDTIFLDQTSMMRRIQPDPNAPSFDELPTQPTEPVCMGQTQDFPPALCKLWGACLKSDSFMQFMELQGIWMIAEGCRDILDFCSCKELRAKIPPEVEDYCHGENAGGRSKEGPMQWPFPELPANFQFCDDPVYDRRRLNPVPKRRLGSMDFGFPIDYSHGFQIPYVPGATITPFFHMKPKLHFYASKNGLTTTVKATITSDLNIGIALHGHLGANVKQSWKKDKIYYHCFAGGVVWVSFVPIYYQPCLRLDGEIEFHAKVGIDFDASTSYTRTGMEFGFNFENGKLSPVTRDGSGSFHNEPLTVHKSGCSLGASVSITPKFELILYASAKITLGPKITLSGDVEMPPPSSYHGEGSNCNCGENRAFVGSNLNAKVLVGGALQGPLEKLVKYTGAETSFEREYFSVDQVLGKKCWTVPSFLAAACPGCPTPAPSCTCTDVEQADCNAWCAFFDAASGPNWKHCSTNRDSPCSCTAVKCANKAITDIVMQSTDGTKDNGLSGTLTSEDTKERDAQCRDYFGGTVSGVHCK
jgi:hypothetical protein